MNMIRTLALVVGCTAAAACSSANLPESQKLSSEKFGEIAARIEAQYPNMAPAKRNEVLRVVVRSLDEMVFIEGGTFEMGDFGWKCDFDPAEVCIWPCGASPDTLCNITMKRDAPLHPVELSNYHLAAKKTTMGDFNLYRSVLGQPIVLSDLAHRTDLAPLFDPLNAAPLETWQEAKDYCQWLGTLSGYPVDLPTEAQWEYAARSRGNKFLYATNDGSLKLGKNYPYDEDHQTLTVRVDAFPPNPLGLYMMTGGATEAVNDWYSDTYFRESPVKDPQGPSSGNNRVTRGTNMSETPWISANTVSRRSLVLESGTHSLADSFRCAIQTKEPLAK
ncbi:formylglycine-generating enzyme family protein [Stutzerimonas nitrititolerans]|uniref:formylglycine-generating enzyme family protein n=1 Tax=Stutzerimonas nitrititolerans TaxID=2482751 RepID=UPI0028AA4635|nr:SUMF1/EgtB/PvdO family nonheme iron enzyme [Stutzerimonas nitrititolerans]